MKNVWPYRAKGELWKRFPKIQTPIKKVLVPPGGTVERFAKSGVSCGKEAQKAFHFRIGTVMERPGTLQTVPPVPKAFHEPDGTLFCSIYGSYAGFPKAFHRFSPMAEKVF